MEIIIWCEVDSSTDDMITEAVTEAEHKNEHNSLILKSEAQKVAQ